MAAAQVGQKPLVIGPETRRFWDYANDHELRMQKCTSCAYVWWPPGPHCPRCWSTENEWTQLSGEGRVVSWVRYHRRYSKEFEPVYPVVMVALDEGPVYQANLLHTDGEDISHDMPVETVFVTVNEGFVLPQFVAKQSTSVGGS